jgi:hypothetical protein
VWVLTDGVVCGVWQGPTQVLDPFDLTASAATEIVVSASSPGLTSAQVTIALSADEGDGVLAVAAASVTDPLHIV